MTESMKITELIRSFRGLDESLFAEVMRHLGFRAAACYEVRGDHAILVLGTHRPSGWSARVPSDLFKYSANLRERGGLGWDHQSLKKCPNYEEFVGGHLYFADRETLRNPLLFVIQFRPGQHAPAEGIHGPLEVMAHRLASSLGTTAGHLPEWASEVLEGQVQAIYQDLRPLLDHEIRNGLAGIEAALADGDLSHKQRNDQVRRHMKRIEVVLDRVHASLSPPLPGEGCNGVAKESVELGDLLARAIQDVEHEDRVDRKPFELRLLSDGASCRVWVERPRMLLALRELVRNARMHSRKGSLTLRIYPSDLGVMVDLDDGGEGVSADAQGLVFMRFYQGVESRDRASLGLGLYLARRVIEEQGGSLTLVRQGARRSFFRLILPRAASAAQLGVAS